MYVPGLVKFRTRHPALAVNDTAFLHEDFHVGKRVVVWKRGGTGQDPVVGVANFSDYQTPNGVTDPAAEYRAPNWSATPGAPVARSDAEPPVLPPPWIVNRSSPGRPRSTPWRETRSPASASDPELTSETLCMRRARECTTHPDDRVQQGSHERLKAASWDRDFVKSLCGLGIMTALMLASWPIMELMRSSVTVSHTASTRAGMQCETLARRMFTRDNVGRLGDPGKNCTSLRNSPGACFLRHGPVAT